MEALVANVDGVKFDIEVALEQQLGAVSLPFQQMDSTPFFYFSLIYIYLCLLFVQSPHRQSASFI